MPDRAATVEGRAKFYSVYLRPWVLRRSNASKAVPHLTDLNLVPNRSRICSKRSQTGNTSYAEAWQTYIRGRIVSFHAKKIISQFMSACCGKSKSDDTMLGEQAMGPSEIEKNEACSVQLQQVHQFLRDAAQPSKQSEEGCKE